MIVSFISNKGGVGKTTLSINLAAYLRKFYDKKVLLIDTNGIYSGSRLFIREFKPYGGRLWNNILITPFFHLRILDSVPNTIFEDLNFLRRVYDYIIFDVFQDKNLILNISRLSDINFLVITPDVFSIYSNKKLYDILDKEKVKIVVNKYDKSFDIETIEYIFGTEIYEVIPIINDVKDFQIYRVPIPYFNEKSKMNKSLDNLAYLLTGERKRKKSLLEKIFGL